MAAPHFALIELAAGRPLPEVRDVDDLVRSACEHKMDGLLWEEVRSGRLAFPRSAALAMAQRYLRTRSHHQRLWASLERAVNELGRRGIEVAAAKGVTAENRWYPSTGSRPSADVDLFLRPSDLPRAAEAIEVIEPGHRLHDVVDSLAEAHHLQSVDLLDKSEVDIDLHFDILKVEIATIQNKVIWDRTVHLDTPGGTQIRALDPETSLILFLLHLTKDRFAYLLGYADVVRLIDREELDWAFIDSFTRNEGLDTHVYMALDTVFNTLQRPPPSHPRPSGWRVRAWRLLWPASIRLGGDYGRLSHHRRQFWIGLTATGRSLESARRYSRRAFPRRELLDYYFPDGSGSYLRRLVTGRSRERAKRRAVQRAQNEILNPPVTVP